MSPDDPASIGPAIKWATYVGIGIFTAIILPLLAWLGKRQVTQWERKIRGLEDEIEELEVRLRGQHDDVADGLGDLKDEVHELRDELQ